MILYPNAKLNIGLNVLRERPDGFHDIETLFVPYFGAKDKLQVSRSREFSIEIQGCDWDPQKDLTVKAYKLLSADFELEPVSIRLEKGIPVGAGMGGGSSDGCFMLIALNELFGLGLDKTALKEYASRLGSDCAFFVENRPVFARGRGEIMQEFDIDLSGYEIRVEKPQGASVNTAQAYRGIKDYCGEPLFELLKLPVDQWKGRVVNDFEETVFVSHPEIAALKEKFYSQGAIYSSMTGSGSAVFGIFAKTNT